ncbi:flagellar biosynthesis protein FliR [Microbacterium halimionae]|uniref:Flagellar biosynthesis protein FliR n=1 Tax=Microbacterium halimionae TaxID=1526413 RepID=A0A7W3PL80_9MICO|nr:hypothetical protein [Microbacterium halimionae]MBA8815594.1 flagellar biosynthesis protein FliR [Microbacterium halimionae]NII95640.1 flagellar biosynthesis protein FliR [Microbacterium halimionae]
MSIAQLRRWSIFLWALSFAFSIAVLLLMTAVATGVIAEMNSGIFGLIVVAMSAGLAVTVISLVLTTKYLRRSRLR